MAEQTVEIHYQNTEQGRAAKRKQRQTILVLIFLLVLIVAVIIVLVLVEKQNANVNDMQTKQLEMCHYADQVYPIDNECGVLTCIDNGIQRSFSLSNGWSQSFINAHNQTSMDMLRYLSENYNVYPNVLDLNNNDKQHMIYENHSIALESIHISIEYLCCHDESEYNKIVEVYAGYQWDEFDVYFSHWMCLNLPNTNTTVYVLLLDDVSQALMSDWTDSFEEHLEQNGIQLLSTPRRLGQPFHSTFAVFDAYSEQLEQWSVETLNYLNDKYTYTNLWKTMPITFSKDNMNVS
eukprot:110592_1